MEGKGVAGGVLRTVFMGTEGQARAPMVHEAGMGGKRALGWPVSPPPERSLSRAWWQDSFMLGPARLPLALDTLSCEWTNWAGSVFPRCRHRAVQTKSQ